MAAARTVLLAGPTALAFFAGGYFAQARNWAGLAVWALVVAGVVLTWTGARLPAAPRARSGPAVWLAPAALIALAAWTLASIAWAPIAGNAYAAGQIAVLYAGGLLAAVLLLRGPDGAAARLALEPAVAAGTLVVVGYGLSERLLPGLLRFAQSATADGRLEQPLTYWNAMGMVAAIGLVVCARLAGDERRRRPARGAAAAAAAPLGLGLYVAFSRGALFACFAGVVTLAVARPDRAQWRAIAVVLATGAIAAAAAAPLPGITGMRGSLGSREAEGALMLVLLALIMAAAWLAQRSLAARPAGPAPRLPQRAPWIAAGVICAALALAVAVGARETAGVPLGGGAGRLTTLRSDRYDYWRVALRAFAHDPLIGVGAGGWSVWWLRYRPYRDGATDAHSLELQTLGELGLVGAALLLALFVGVGLAAARAIALDPETAAGPLAGCVVYLAHSPLDWDWQMPALTLIAVALAGSLIASATDGQ